MKIPVKAIKKLGVCVGLGLIGYFYAGERSYKKLFNQMKGLYDSEKKYASEMEKLFDEAQGAHSECNHNWYEMCKEKDELLEISNSLLSDEQKEEFERQKHIKIARASGVPEHLIKEIMGTKEA